jgi:hypothetical protein
VNFRKFFKFGDSAEPIRRLVAPLGGLRLASGAMGA